VEVPPGRTRSYRDLRVWQRAIDLVVETYRLTGMLPKREVYGLASQMQRAAVSIAANIAEGNGRSHRGEYLQHLSIARGSLTELETHLVVAGRLGLLTATDAARAVSMAGQVGAMLTAMQRSLGKRFQAGVPLVPSA
jgi:four helix bundle protein